LPAFAHSGQHRFCRREGTDDLKTVDLVELGVGHRKRITRREIAAYVVDEDLHFAHLADGSCHCPFDGFRLHGVGREESDLRPGVGPGCGLSRGATASLGTRDQSYVESLAGEFGCQRTAETLAGSDDRTDGLGHLGSPLF
jgi:hypothetical protein